MDSLTQIVLGAACGEVALRRKIGNKAMLFGAFGGTIPDLDVMIGSLLFDYEIDQLAFYSLFDQNDIPVKFTSVSKNHDLLDINHPDLKTLRWFSQNFFSAQFIDTTGQLIYRDLRYPLIREDNVNSSIFSYELVRKGDRWDIKPLFDGAISKGDLNQFIKRIFGR